MAEQWMTESQRYCLSLLNDWIGAHNVPFVKPCGNGIKVSVSAGLSTFDSDNLTRLVLLAHDRCVRIELAQGGPYRIGIKLHRRYTRKGGFFDRHPTIEQAIEAHRKIHPAPTEDHFPGARKMVGREEDPTNG
jgi:hypothetical protein